MNGKSYTAPLLRRWWLLLAAVALALAASFVRTRGLPLTYSAHVTLMVGRAIENPNPSGSEMGLTYQLAGTYADIAGRKPVREATMAALGLRWLPEYTVARIPDTQLIAFTVIDTDPARARDVANELANQLIRLAPTNAGDTTQEHREFISSELDDLQAKIKETRVDIARKQEELANLYSARQIADAQTQISGLQAKLTTLQANYAALLSNTRSGAVNTLSIIESADLPTDPIGPKRVPTILLAAAVALLLACATAYFLEYLDDTFHSRNELEKALKLTTLAAVPRVINPEELQALPMGRVDHTPAMEAYRMLRTNLEFAELACPLHTLLVTSPGPLDGKSMTAANLAVAEAQVGKRVVLLDCDLRRPSQHTLFGLPNNVGLANALLVEPHECGRFLAPTTVDGLLVMTAGREAPNPAEILSSERMNKLLEEMRSHADLVVIDSPPATIFADAIILAAKVDGVALVVNVGRTRRPAVRATLSALEQVHARVLGVVLNRIQESRSNPYYRYYRQAAIAPGRKGTLVTRTRSPRKRSVHSQGAT